MIIFLIISYLLVLFIGIFIGYIFNNNNEKLKTELLKTKNQLSNYQHTINNHMNKTQIIMDNIYRKFNELKKHSELYNVIQSIDNNKDIKSIISRDNFNNAGSNVEEIKVIPKDYELKDENQ